MELTQIESANQVMYARTLADIVIHNAILTARDVLRATGATGKDLEHEVDSALSKATLWYTSDRPAKDKPKWPDTVSEAPFIKVFNEVHRIANTKIVKLAKKIADSKELEELYTKELGIDIPEMLAQLLMKLILEDKEYRESKVYAQSPCQSDLHNAYDEVKFNESFFKNMQKEGKDIWDYAKELKTVTK